MREAIEFYKHKHGINKPLELARQGNLVLTCKESSDAGGQRRHITEVLTNKRVKTNPFV